MALGWSSSACRPRDGEEASVCVTSVAQLSQLRRLKDISLSPSCHRTSPGSEMAPTFDLHQLNFDFK